VLLLPPDGTALEGALSAVVFKPVAVPPKGVPAAELLVVSVLLFFTLPSGL
jgi:hypothetical protein